MSGLGRCNRYEYDEWADFLFQESEDPSKNYERDMLIERFGSIAAFSAKVHAAVARVCSELELDPPGIDGMHRATFLSAADYMGHGLGLWEIVDDEPWAAKLRPVILIDKEFATVMTGLEG